ncbi:MAG: helix-turn-helix transcriptional regulator [Oscillospiraceae bacterium]|nr:helix-turn-helix transcriptional regulator [Oscillospiraceae bacterium]
MRELEIIQHRQIEGLSLFFDTVEYRTPHFHPEWELIWVTDGTLSVHYGASVCEGCAGDLFLFHPGQVHEFRRIGDTPTFLCLQIAPQLFADAAPILGRTVLEDSHLNPSLSEEQARQTRQLLRQITADYLDRPAFYELSCVGLCGSLLHLLLTAVPCRTMTDEERSQSDQRNARLERFIRFVDENYMHKIRLSDFAAAEGCSTSYLSRFIKAAMNQTFQAYVNSVRYHCACRLIDGGGMRMLDVCEESGFSDYRYFSTAFKAQSGLTPEEYSRKAAGDQEAPVRRSLHSLERFYTREQSKALLARLRSD